MSGDISYKTHILIGVRPKGVMSVIADWPHVPRQAEVQKEIEAARDGYVTFVLCTPTSILPAGGHGDAAGKGYKSGRGMGRLDRHRDPCSAQFTSCPACTMTGS